MTKKEFLKDLEKELKKIKYHNTQDILDYYEELIEDRKESGKKENEIITNLDSPKKIVANIKAEKQIEIAENKPTNGLKALLAFLGILSLPLLIPLFILLFAIFITIGSLVFSVILVIMAISFTGVIALAALIAALFLGKLPFTTTIFSIGAVLIVLGSLTLLLQWLFSKTKIITISIIEYLRKKINTKKEVTKNE